MIGVDQDLIRRIGYSIGLARERAGITVEQVAIALGISPDLLRDVEEAEMPPPFRHMTPLSSDDVARAVVAAVKHRKKRVVLPFPANTLLLGEALSPRLGDLVAAALTRRPIAKLFGVSRGSNYHATIAS
jgi:hypothetical protein